MLISKMYKFEKVVYEYQHDEICKKTEQYYKPVFIGKKLCVSCDVRGLPYKVHNMDEAKYLEAALSLPYYEMLEQVYYFNNTMMDESDESFWIQDLAEKYNVDGYLVVLRLHAVEKLDRNLIYRKLMQNLYKDDEKQKTYSRIKK